MTIAVLNLGNIQRPPHFANGKGFPKHIRDNPGKIREHLVLPYLVLNSPAHIVTLCESFGFALFNDLCVEFNVIRLQCMKTKRHASPPMSIFLRSSCGTVELCIAGTSARKHVPRATAG